jgi:hypothetical protein
MVHARRSAARPGSSVDDEAVDAIKDLSFG